MSLLLFLLFGFVVGLIARALVPGNQGMGFVKTTLLGAVGSFVGGLIGNLISGHGLTSVHSAGWIGSVVGAVVLLAVLSRRG
jgi:uncharacterized membrane protein YeaQ/YmgE (transglycosylase-associated protein family)